jgi:tRNA threonylcarbamoyl adenosine modification protein YeaZ
MLLALETATNVCSVAFKNDEGEVYELRTEERGSHSEQLFLFIEQLQKEHDFTITELDAMLVSEGPGSYTGLRISASAIKGLLFQTEVPLYGINTLASFAMSAVKKSAQTIHSIIDARRVHVYRQTFSYVDKELTALTKVEVVPIEMFEAEVAKGDLIVGTGLNRLSGKMRDKAITYDQRLITAKSLLMLFENEKAFCRQEDPENFEPKYYTSNQVQK